jgi:hypothetical protein
MLAFDLPEDLGSCRVSCRIAWLRSEGLDAKRGAGLSFLQMDDGSRNRILSYLSRFQQLAADVDFQA